MSTIISGRITSSFIRSTSVVPPARNCTGLCSASAPFVEANAARAASGVSAR
jgi:hypothetical protein